MGKDLIDEVANLYENRRPYWDKKPSGPRYSLLNQIQTPSDKIIREYQIQQIEKFQLLAKSSKTVEKINTLFANGNINNAAIAMGKDEQLKINAVISGIIGIINGTYDYQNNKKNNSKYKYNALNKQLKNLQSQLLSIKEKININSQVYENHLQDLEKAIAASELKGLSDADIENWYSHINFLKGDVVEEIGTAWLNQLNIPNVRTITTGGLAAHATKDATNSTQLIQDIMTLSVNEVQLSKIPMTYRLPGAKTPITTTLGEFLKAMEEHSGDKQKIILSDEAYGTLKELSALNIQAKAGFNQTPWNETSKNTFVSINEFKENAKLGGVGVKHAFELLVSLDNEKPKDQWIKDDSADYNAMANYGLATALAKVLHLGGKEGNQYLLTPQGFTTYNERIAYLLNKHQSIIKLSSPVLINKNTMSLARSVKIPKSWNNK